MNSYRFEISNLRENKYCSHEVSFRLHFKTTPYFDGHVVGISSRVVFRARLPEVNSNRFEISNRFEMSFCLHGNLHRDFIAASFQTIARPYCTCANDYLLINANLINAKKCSQ